MANDNAWDADRRICLGRITSARGLKGEVWIRTFTRLAADVAAYGPPTDAEGKMRFPLTIVEAREDRVVARIAGIEDRTQAEALRGTTLYVERRALPPPEEDEYYHADLIGLAVRVASAVGAAAGPSAGRVVAVHDFGGGSVLEIEPSAEIAPATESILVPFTRTTVPRVDLAAGEVTIVSLPGLFGGGDDADATAATAGGRS